MSQSTLTRRVIGNLTDDQLKIAAKEALQGKRFEPRSSGMLAQVMEMCRPGQGCLVPEAEVADEVLKAAAEKWVNQP